MIRHDSKVEGTLCCGCESWKLRTLLLRALDAFAALETQLVTFGSLLLSGTSSNSDSRSSEVDI